MDRENGAIPEDFLLPGETNLLKGITIASQRLLGSNSLDIFEQSPRAIKAAIVADALEQEAKAQGHAIEAYAKHLDDTDAWVDLISRAAEA